MQDFVHLHVHTQYSILDGQASIPKLVDKAIANGMKGIAVTDHGAMFGIKEFFNYVNKKNGGTNGEIKDLKKKIAALEKGESLKILKKNWLNAENSCRRHRTDCSSRLLDVRCMWHAAGLKTRMVSKTRAVTTL